MLYTNSRTMAWCVSLSWESGLDERKNLTRPTRSSLKPLDHLEMRTVQPLASTGSKVGERRKQNRVLLTNQGALLLTPAGLRSYEIADKGLNRLFPNRFRGLHASLLFRPFWVSGSK